MADDLLFSPFPLKNFILKNRIGVAPMTRMSGGPSSIPRQDVLEFLVRRAHNGAALVYTEALVTDYESAQGYPGQARLLTQPQIEAWSEVVREIQAAGSLAIMQMFHCGRMAWPEVNPAHRAIEIHGAHGYLNNQFLSSYSNKRTDSYAGSVAGRYRFAHEVIQAVHQVMPKNRLLLFRISNWAIADTEVSQFSDQAEYQQIVSLLNKEPLDALSVSTYDFQEPAFGSGKTMAALSREVCDLPLLICGKIYDRATAEEALQHADIVLSGKSMLLNPNWVEDVREGRSLKPFTSDQSQVAYTEEPLP
jgi:2,4-dienoyl-CoA reductase-like NADH-dependent reductase (Old Yellow Enzyme family)